MKNGENVSNVQRRKFLSNLTIATGSAVLVSSPFSSIASVFVEESRQITVGEIMNSFIREVPNGAIPNTVDTLKSGNADIVVTGVVTCMFATIEVIRKTIALGANFIIAHEPTFYNHQDATKWLENDEVFKYKSELLKKHNIAVWRNHDYIHSVHPDGVRKGLVERLSWGKYGNPDQNMYNFTSALSLKELIHDLKAKLEIPSLRYIGDLKASCSKILLMPGAAGGQRQIEAIIKNRPDVLVTGEISEWETAEYVRDARAKGENICLIVLGHVASEEDGATFMLNWLKNKFPSVKANFIKTGASLSML